MTSASKAVAEADAEDERVACTAPPIMASGRTLKSLAKDSARKPVVVWVDGCFDMMHYGHANALRQAREMGDLLIVGVHSDAAIKAHKGPPVMAERERYAAVAACKWVDVVVPRAPYLTSVAVLDAHQADFCAHGDDITTLADGTDCYLVVKSANRYREFRRTLGISTTDLVGRMLLLTRAQPSPSNVLTVDASTCTAGHNDAAANHLKVFASSKNDDNSYGTVPDDCEVVYYAGVFDLFHVGHVARLCRAKRIGGKVCKLVVGVYGDKTANEICAKNPVLMNVHERALSLLSCRYVDDIIIDAPRRVPKEYLDNGITGVSNQTWKISHVVTFAKPTTAASLSPRTQHLQDGACEDEDQDFDGEAGREECEEAAKRNMLTVLQIGGKHEKDVTALDQESSVKHLQGLDLLSARDILWRIIEHRTAYEERNKKKQKGH